MIVDRFLSVLAIELSVSEMLKLGGEGGARFTLTWTSNLGWSFGTARGSLGTVAGIAIEF
jgi:hypothetical protein